MKAISKMNEFELAIEHRDALRREDYLLCQKIKNEVDARIENQTIDHSFMNGFRSFDSSKQQFYGPPKFGAFNGLFDKYQFK